MSAAPMTLELAPGVDPQYLGYAVTNRVTRIDGWTLYTVDGDEPGCRILTADGSTTLLGWLHGSMCPMTGGGKCAGGTPRTEPSGQPDQGERP